MARSERSGGKSGQGKNSQGKGSQVKSGQGGKRKAAEPADPPFGRLCLVTPAAFDPQAFAPILDAALNGGDVATLFIIAEGLDAAGLAAAAERLVPIAQANGVATIVSGEALLDLCAADGLDVTGGLTALVDAVERLHPARIVGASGLHTRHDAMVLAETECDYLFFGRFDGDTEAGIHDKTLDLAAWWSALFEIPAIVMGGRDLASVREAAAARIEFVALRRAVWEHPEGPAAAIAEANRIILAVEAETAP